LSIATQALEAQEAAISVTSNNIANANTPGYSRETVVLTEAPSNQQGSVSLGGGVTLQGYTSVRDQLLDVRIQQQTSQQSSADAETNALDQVQTLFPSSGDSLGTDFSAFFTSVSSLSANPDSSALRQTVISSGQDLANQFNSISSGLTSQQTSLNQQVVTDVAQINQLSSQIATLNTQAAQLSAGGQNSGTVVDQIDEDELSLSKLTNISITHTEGADTITTGNGTPLVLGNQSFALTTSPNASGVTQVLDSSGNNITSTISSGDLGGTIQTRDTSIPGLLTQLDTLANQFATAINAAQAQGYNQNGTAGTALFTVPSTVAGSAAEITLATTNPAAIAASSDGSSGSNGNVANLSAVATSNLASGLTPSGTSASLVYQVGSLTSNASTQSTALGVSLAQLTQQQSSVSGVSIDEESANLIQYQQAYQAAAQVITVINTLFTATIDILPT
jgi:flagellar hook-associated protein 1 FlgK